MDPFTQILVGLSEQELARLLGISTDMKNVSREPSTFATNTAVQEILALGIDGTSGFAALHAQIATLAATLALDITSILTAISSLAGAVGAPAQAGVPVTIDGASLSDVASSVWGYASGAFNTNAADFLGAAGSVAKAIKFDSALRVKWSPFWTTWLNNDNNLNNIPSEFPVLSLSAASPGTDLLSACVAQNAAYGFDWYNGDQGYVVTTHGPAGSNSCVTAITGAEWTQLLATFYGSAARAVAPVWPGLAGVTVGASHSLVDGLAIAGPLAGVLIDITSVPNPIAYYPFGSIRSYVRAGAVIFTDDVGDSEFPQPLGPANAILLPKSMGVATTATFRIPSGIVGSATPFTIP